MVIAHLHFAGPEEQSPSSSDEEGSTCDGWEDGAAFSKDTRAVQSIKSIIFSLGLFFPKSTTKQCGDNS